MKYAPLLMLALGGCATTSTQMTREPSETVRSTKSAEGVAACIANKNGTNVETGEDGGRMIRIKNGYGGVGMIFAVYPDGEGTRVEIRKSGIAVARHRQCY